MRADGHGSAGNAEPADGATAHLDGGGRTAGRSGPQGPLAGATSVRGLYADFGDFSLWRIRIGGALLVGGFARARRLRPADLLPGADAVAAIAEAEPSILAHCNGDHADALAAIAGAAGGGLGPWRMIAVDTDGFDLGQSERVLRIPWPAPVANPEGVRAALIALARAARGS